MVLAFREQGFVVVPDVLGAEQVAVGRRIVAEMLAEEPYADDHVGSYFLWPRLNTASHSLLDFYRETGIGELAAELVRPELGRWDHAVRTRRPTRHVHHARGIWLTDQSELHRGNLWIWPGTHLRFGTYLAEHGADALTRLDEMNPGPYPKVELGEPAQAVGPAGSVLFAHYLLAHNIGGHDGTADDDRRETIYYRLHATGHRDRWREVVTDPLVEFRQA